VNRASGVRKERREIVQFSNLRRPQNVAHTHEDETHRRLTSLSFSWSVDGFLSKFIMGRLRKSCCVLSDVNGSLLMGDCDCWRCRRCGYCCLKDVLKFMKAEIDGELPSRTEFCVRQNEIVEIFRWLEVSGGFGDGAGEASHASVE
jgi:hypothetical protein